MSLQNSPVNLFKRTFLKAEWEQVEEYLIDAVHKIEVPARVTPDVIQKLNAHLDRLSAPSMWLYQLTKRNYESIEMDRKNAEKQVYMLVKDITDDEGKSTGKKRTEAEISAAIVQYLNTTPLQTHPAPIYVMEKMAMERFMFIDAVVSTMRQKADKLITDLGAIKLEIMVNPNGNVDGDEQPARGRPVAAGSN